MRIWHKRFLQLFYIKRDYYWCSVSILLILDTICPDRHHLHLVINCFWELEGNRTPRLSIRLITPLCQPTKFLAFQIGRKTETTVIDSKYVVIENPQFLSLVCLYALRHFSILYQSNETGLKHYF